MMRNVDSFCTTIPYFLKPFANICQNNVNFSVTDLLKLYSLIERAELREIDFVWHSDGC